MNRVQQFKKKMTDTQEIRKKKNRSFKCILFNWNCLYKTVVFWIIKQHEREVYEKSVYYCDEFVKKKKLKYGL